MTRRTLPALTIAVGADVASFRLPEELARYREWSSPAKEPVAVPYLLGAQCAPVLPEQRAEAMRVYDTDGDGVADWKFVAPWQDYEETAAAITTRRGYWPNERRTRSWTSPPRPTLTARSGPAGPPESRARRP